MDRILEQNDTLFKLFEYSAARWHGRPMASYTDGAQAYTYGSFQEKVLKMSVLLARHHVYGGKVAILAENCPNWTVAFFASAAMGRVAVPILPASSQMEVSNILDHSESEALFVSARQLRKVEEGLRKKMKLIVDIDTLDVISAQNNGETEQNRKVAARNAAPQPNDLAVIIYTSGTSGSPKGVMLSHGNLMDRWLSILPMAHAYEMALGMLYPLSVGAQVYYLKGMPVPSVLLEAMRQVRPTIILTVPLIIEKVYKSVCRTVDADRRLSLMRRRTPWLLDILLGAKLRKMTGGCLKFYVMLGYYKDPSRTAKAIRQDGWFHTGDLAAMDAKGRFYIRGRLNNVILGATGENIYPEEIEFVINSYPGVGESLVVERGRDLVGLVHMEEGAEHGSLADAAKSILEYVNKRVNKQSALARIEMLTEPFMKTATQKIRRFLYMTPSHA